MLEEFFRELGVEPSKSHILRFQECSKIGSTIDLYYKIAQGELGLKDLKECLQQHDKGKWLNIITRPFSRSKPHVPQKLSEDVREKMRQKQEPLIEDEVEYRISDCCNPIPGDDIIGFKANEGQIWIHRTNCQEAIQLMTKYGNRIIRTNWTSREANTYLAGVRLGGFDNRGLINEITKVITEKMNLNIRSFHIDSTGEIYEASIMVLVSGVDVLHQLMAELKKVKGIENVSRINASTQSSK